jgi:general secretion pathway protein F
LSPRGRDLSRALGSSGVRLFRRTERSAPVSIRPLQRRAAYHGPLHFILAVAQRILQRVSPSPLKFDIRADLFRQLAAMEDAGLPVDKALSLARLPLGARRGLTSMRRCLGKGLGVAQAGLQSGLFTPFEASLLRAATSAGSPAHTYRRLADHCARRAAHMAAIKSRMMLPLAMVVIAILVQPLPSLVAGTLSPGGYLIRCLLALIALGGAVWLFTGLPYSFQSGSLLGRKAPLDRVSLRMPLFGPIYIRRNVRDCFQSLALLLEAGMPILEALPLSVDTIRSRAIKQQFSQIKPRIEEGASFADAIGELSFVSAQAHAMVLAGEASGALPEVLFRYSESETGAIDQFDDLVAQWTPRVLYALVALWIGYGIVRSGAFMPSLPPDLR